MAVLEKALVEEYQRVQLKLQRIESELSELPKGYISEKQIKDNTYYYLQRREKKKIVSEYIKKDEVAHMRRALEYRKALEGKKQDVLKEFDRLRKILGIYTEEEKLELIKEGLKAADEGRTISADVAFGNVMKEISYARKIRSRNNGTSAEMDR